MYKVLIADDEEIIRRGLVKMLESDKDLSIVAEAEDGEMALELAAEHLPDLLLVDINMPFLSGLDFIEKLGDMLHGAVILVITGYDDFAFAQRALRLGVFDYLLKPIMEDVFQDAVHRAKHQLAQNRKQVKYLEWSRMQMAKNRATLVANFLMDWLGARYSETEVREQAEYLGLEIPEPYGITIAHLNLNEGKRNLGTDWDQNLMYYAAENIAIELFEPMSPFITCRNTSDDLVIISSCDPAQEWSDTGRKMVASLEEHIPVHVEISQIRGTDFPGLPQAYDTAMDQLRQRLNRSTVISDTIRYIEQNYANPDLSLISAANRQHLSPQHLSRLFRHETGITFVDYVTRMRIRRAMELLIGTDLRMYEIAERVGYASQHYFSSAFKKVLGVSPAEYRRSKQKPF